MNCSPFLHETWFHLGPVPVSSPVATTWAIMALLVGLSIVLTRRLMLVPTPRQAVLELVAGAIDAQIRDVMQQAPGPYRSLIGTIFLLVLTANWSSLIPGVEPPTATLETDAALAMIVLAAAIWHGIRTRGIAGYLGTFAEPSWVMIPLNVFEQISRTFSMIVRLFGNIMSGVFIVGIVLSLAALLVPIPLMALDLLTGAVQAYIFSVLAMVFIGAAVGGGQGKSSGGPDLNSEPERSEK